MIFEADLAPETYSVSGTMSRPSMVGLGFRNAGSNRSAGVQVGSLISSEPIVQTTPPCGIGLHQATVTFTVQFTVTASGDVCP